MSDRVKLAREIAARTEPRFIHTTASEDTTDLKALARKIAARTSPRFVTIHRHRGGSPVFTEVELTAKRGGLTAEEYRWSLSESGARIGHSLRPQGGTVGPPISPAFH